MKTPEEKSAANIANTRAYRQRHPGRAAESTKKHRDNLSPEKRAAMKEREARYRIENAEYLKHLARTWKDKNKERERIRELQRSARRIKIKYIGKFDRPMPGVCDICGEQESARGKNGIIRSLCFDHCHITEKFRGWLCTRCNMVLGKIKDDPKIAIRMAEYLAGGALS